MRRTTAAILALFFILLFSTHLQASCPDHRYVGNLSGGFLANCPDTAPLPAFAFALADPYWINSSTVDVACEYEGAPAPIFGFCGADAGRVGDGHATLFIDWGPYGYSDALGCPASYGAGNGTGRIVLVAAAPNGASSISSIAFNEECNA